MTPERRDALLRQLTWGFTAMAASTGWGPDIDWLASDRDGHLAVLATAGLGAIPARVTRDPVGLVGVIEEIENLKGSGFEFEEFIRDPARVGFFAFDYAGDKHPSRYVAGRPYQRVGEVPAEPLVVTSFRAAANYLRDVRFRELCFSQSTEIVVEDAFAEIYRPTQWDQSSRPKLLHPVAPRPEPPADEPRGGRE
jgi:hypothetical protein